MKFIVSSQVLLKQLQAIGGVLNSSNTLPILDNFLFEIKDQNLTISCSDLESTMTSTLAIDAKSEVSVAIPAKMLLDILSRDTHKQLSYIETTITDSNPGSWALFTSLAKELNTELIRSEFFTKELHFQGVHDTENLVRIGPFQR